MFRFFNRRIEGNRAVASEASSAVVGESANPPLDDDTTITLPDQPERGQTRRKTDRENVLTVGSNITVQGKVRGCDMLYIEGEADVKVAECGALVVAESGRFHGNALVRTAEIAGLLTGNLVCTGRLVLRATGRIDGKVRYGALEIDTGGDLAGNIRALPVKDRSSTEESFFGLVRYR